MHWLRLALHIGYVIYTYYYHIMYVRDCAYFMCVQLALLQHGSSKDVRCKWGCF